MEQNSAVIGTASQKRGIEKVPFAIAGKRQVSALLFDGASGAGRIAWWSRTRNTHPRGNVKFVEDLLASPHFAPGDRFIAKLVVEAVLDASEPGEARATTRIYVVLIKHGGVTNQQKTATLLHIARDRADQNIIGRAVNGVRKDDSPNSMPTDAQM